jgi:hypothetical protein
MTPLHDGQMLVSQVFGSDYSDIRWAFVYLDERLRNEIVKSTLAWRAAAQAYGSSAPRVTVWDGNVLWLSALPRVLDASSLSGGYGQWEVIEPSSLLTLSTDPDELDMRIKVDLENLSFNMSYSNIVVESDEDVHFEGGEKHGSGDATTGTLPEEVIKWALGPRKEE